ncbi:uncharacterized protein ACO6RY_18059 [Pungitius sinensis]
MTIITKTMTTHPTAVTLETIIVETTTTQITNPETFTVQKCIYNMATIIDLLFTISMETTKAIVKSINMATTTPQHITMETITVQLTTATATNQTLKAL